MDDQIILQALQQIFKEVFARPDLVVGPETTAFDVDGWDSLMMVQIILRIQSLYSIRISGREVQNLENVGDLVSLISSRLS